MTFESAETVFGRVRQADECIEYRASLKVEEAGDSPVSLELSFVPPHPFTVNMPECHHIQAQNITEAYSRLVEFLDDYGIDLIY